MRLRHALRAISLSVVLTVVGGLARAGPESQEVVLALTLTNNYEATTTNAMSVNGWLERVSVDMSQSTCTCDVRIVSTALVDCTVLNKTNLSVDTNYWPTVATCDQTGVVRAAFTQLFCDSDVFTLTCTNYNSVTNTVNVKLQIRKPE